MKRNATKTPIPRAGQRISIPPAFEMRFVFRRDTASVSGFYYYAPRYFHDVFGRFANQFLFGLCYIGREASTPSVRAVTNFRETEFPLEDFCHRNGLRRPRHRR